MSSRAILISVLEKTEHEILWDTNYTAKSLSFTKALSQLSIFIIHGQIGTHLWQPHKYVGISRHDNKDSHRGNMLSYCVRRENGMVVHIIGLWRDYTGKPRR